MEFTEPMDKTLLTLPKLIIEFTDRIEPTPLIHNKEKKPLMDRIQSIVYPKQNIEFLCLPPKFLQYPDSSGNLLTSALPRSLLFPLLERPAL